MRQQILITVFSFICLVMTAQTVMLGTHQTYIPVITQHGDTLFSSVAQGNQWYKNDVAIDGATDQTYVCTESANYKVVVTYLSNGCSSSSEKYNIETALSYINIDPVCKVYPNPSKGQFILVFGSDVSGRIQLELLTIDGKLVQKSQLEDISQDYDFSFGDSQLAKGTYTLRIRTNAGIVNRLIIVQ